MFTDKGYYCTFCLFSAYFHARAFARLLQCDIKTNLRFRKRFLLFTSLHMIVYRVVDLFVVSIYPFPRLVRQTFIIFQCNSSSAHSVNRITRILILERQSILNSITLEQDQLKCISVKLVGCPCDLLLRLACQVTQLPPVG